MAFAFSISTTLALSLPTAQSPRTRKPRNYWASRENLIQELDRFQRECSLPPYVMPTAAQLLAAGRADILRALERHGGITVNALRLGLQSSRHHQRLQRLKVPQTKLQVAPAKPIGAVQHYQCHLHPKSNPQDQKPKRKRRKDRHHWNTWRNLEIELHHFANSFCDGHMPLQRELLAYKRSDLINAVRIHGGTACVARRAGLAPSPRTTSRRPHGYWDNPSVLRAELLTFLARNGYPGLMPRREQLLRAGRTDLSYAIMRHGGYSTVAAMMHLIWHGPSSFWRVFRHVQDRLLAFVKSSGGGNLMPSLQKLQKFGRMDLVYGIALHGGVMVVAERVGLSVVFPHVDLTYWEDPSNVQRELESVIETQPLERRQFMPSSVSLVQAGRADLASAIRDRGGWIYYGQRLGLRFAFEVRNQGFWQRESNVALELSNYVRMRYGNWEHPGKQLNDRNNLTMGYTYIPSLEMLKRDGRSDIAFAIKRYHGGIEAFAARNSFLVAEDVVHIQPTEVLMKWTSFVAELTRWIEQYGAEGIMPSKQDLIRTGRHDLRYGLYRHGGSHKVSTRLQLVFTKTSMDHWLPQWLGLQAGKLGLAVQLAQNRNSLSEFDRDLLDKLEVQLSGRVLGTRRRLTTCSTEIVDTGSPSPRQNFTDGNISANSRPGPNHSNGQNKHLSRQDICSLRLKYKHLPPDDIIAV